MSNVVDGSSIFSFHFLFHVFLYSLLIINLIGIFLFRLFGKQLMETNFVQIYSLLHKLM